MKKDATSKIFVQALVHDTFSEFVDFARDHRYNIEIATFAYSNVYETDWQRVLQQQKQKISSFEGKISLHGVFQDVLIHSSDAKIAEVSKERVRSNLEVARELKAAEVVFHGNFSPLVKEEYYRKNWIERNAVFWSEILDEYQVSILLENTWEQTPDMFRNLLDKVNSPRFKICFDVGHANVYSNTPLAEWFASLGKDMPYIHLSDNAGEKDRHLEIGGGKINWQVLSELIKEYGNNPEIVLEVVSTEKTKQSLKYLEENCIYPFGESHES